MKRFENKVAIVTGADRGLGAQYAKDLAKEGAITVIFDIREDDIKKTVAEIEAAGGKADGYVADITDVDKVNSFVEAVVEKHGGVDILINNAAYHKGQEIIDTSVEDWKAQVEVNLNGTFYCTKAVLSHMLKKEYGKILNIASAGAKIVFSGFGASKAGIVSFTGILSEEVKLKNINVNAMYLGMVNTEYTRERMDEMMQPPEVSKVVLFLVSDDASPMKP